jgi:glucose-6-phosphate-specific signal transduction histidine kinase
MLSTATIQRYSIGSIREEAINLLQTGVIALNQPLRILFKYLPARQWNLIECELERHDLLLRDHIIDLVGAIDWESD